MKPLALVSEVPAQGAGALRVDIDGTSVGLYRVGDDVVAWRDVCPHAAAPVCRGLVNGTLLPSRVYDYVFGREDEILECPWHGWEFDLRTGDHLAEGSGARLRKYPVEVRGEEIYDVGAAAQRVDLTVVVESRVELAENIVGLRLARKNGERFPAWLPGTHIEVELPSGESRHYSLCGDPSNRFAVDIAVLREPQGRGGSEFIHREVLEGSSLRITAIRNRFRTRQHPAYLVIAGGVGITALLPMIRSLARQAKPLTVLYVGRRRENMAFVPELEAMKQVTLVETRTEARPNLERIVEAAHDGTGIYACGPLPMMEELTRLRAEHSPRVDIITEVFSAAAGTPPTASPVAHESTAFRVHAARHNLWIDVAKDESVLAALRRAGVPATSSCENGWCGSCETAVLSGNPDHRDSVLDDVERAENASMMICVSRATSDCLSLDV